MTIHHYGGREYEGSYVIDHEGLVFGPFESMSDAAEYAMKELDLPFTVRDLLTPKLTDKEKS